MNTPKNGDAKLFLADEATEGLLLRLRLLKFDPKEILVFAPNSEMQKLLGQHYPQANIKCIAGLSHAIHSDPSQLSSLADHSVDMIIANFFLPWQSPIDAFLKEWRGLIAPHGLLMITMLGPNTMPNHVLHRRLQLIDLGDLGDLLMATGWLEPVLEKEELIAIYRNEQQCCQELDANGIIEQPVFFKTFPMECPFELIYAHAFAPIISLGHHETTIPVSHVATLSKHKKG